MAEVTLQKVCKRYDEVSVIEDLDLEVRDGEFMVLVGPSGCGKSTVLRMIAGLEDISAGTIAIGGRVVNELAPKDRDIAMVFQNYALYPHMTIRENLEFGRLQEVHRRGADEVGDEQIAGTLVDLERLPHLLDTAVPHDGDPRLRTTDQGLRTPLPSAVSGSRSRPRAH